MNLKAFLALTGHVFFITPPKTSINQMLAIS